MTVSSTTRSAGPFAGSGAVPAAMPFTFKVFDSTDVAVYLTDTDGVQTRLGSGYTVSLNADQQANPGGTVTYSSTLATGASLMLLSEVPYTQGVNLTGLGRFSPEVNEGAFDKLTALVQQLFELMGRALRLPVGESGPLTLPSADERASSYLAFDADGEPIASTGTPGTVPVSTFAETLLDDASASAARSTLGLGSDGSYGLRNRIINGAFAVNQRAKSGTVVLAAGAYGHDRWKAGAGGCTYTFTTNGARNIITISAGSLMQVVDAANVEGGVYTLTHQGSAQARIAVSGASTSGSYAAASTASPLQSASATEGQTVAVEFSTGTVDRVMLEPGTSATAFERRPYALEVHLCRRYWREDVFGVSFIATAGAQSVNQYFVLEPPMRTAPTASVGTATINTNAASRTFTVRTATTVLQQATSTAAGVVALENPVQLDAEI